MTPSVRGSFVKMLLRGPSMKTNRLMLILSSAARLLRSSPSLHLQQAARAVCPLSISHIALDCEMPPPPPSRQ